MKLAYMAHPLGADGPEREKNRANATKWFGWLHDQFPSLVFTANWIILSGAWPESDEHRKRGLEIDMVHVERSDLIFYVGGRMSPGMIKEQERAAKRGSHQVDLTFLGYGPPEREVLPNNIVSNMIQAIESGYFRELDKALARLSPLDPEQRAAFDKELSERLSFAAMARTKAYKGRPACERKCCNPGPDVFPERPALKGCVLPGCTKENPCSWCRDNGAVSFSKAAGQPEGSNLSRPDEGGSG